MTLRRGPRSPHGSRPPDPLIQSIALVDEYKYKSHDFKEGTPIPSKEGTSPLT